MDEEDIEEMLRNAKQCVLMNALKTKYTLNRYSSSKTKVCCWFNATMLSVDPMLVLQLGESYYLCGDV
jgi:hypothetical protein